MAEEKYIPQSKLADYRKSNMPESCPLLGHEDFSPVVDHDHKTGKIRGVVSLEGNALLGKVENFYRSRCVNSAHALADVLRKLADYIEQEQGPLHPVGVRQLTKRFSRLSKQEQVSILNDLGVCKKELACCKNTKARTKLYRRLLLEE